MSDEPNKVVDAATNLSWAGVIKNLQKGMKYVKDQIPAIALAIFNYLVGTIKQKELENKKLQLELDKRTEHDKIDEANSTKSDSDIIDDAIRAGSGSDGKPGSSSGSGS